MALNKEELIEYRLLRGVSKKAVARNCDISYTYVRFIESGRKKLTQNAYKEYVKGVNKAYKIKKQKEKNAPVVKVVKPPKPPKRKKPKESCRPRKPLENTESVLKL